VKVVNVSRNRNHEVECILVDDTLSNVEEFGLQTCNTPNTQVISMDHVKNIPYPNSGTQPGLITPYIWFRITTGLSEECSGAWPCFVKWEVLRVSKKYDAFIFRVGISENIKVLIFFETSVLSLQMTRRHIPKSVFSKSAVTPSDFGVK
jgi:hypothetical protein